MSQVTLQQVLELAQQLPIEEQTALVEMLDVKRSNKRPALDLPIIDIGPWPDEVSLRREDWYGDDGR